MFDCELVTFQCKLTHNVILFQIDYAAISSVCNTCRNFGDIDDSWDSVTRIINYYATDDQNFTSVAGPGFFNDPDMVDG